MDGEKSYRPRSTTGCSAEEGGKEEEEGYI
jgi:hypothetical protein